MASLTGNLELCQLIHNCPLSDGKCDFHNIWSPTSQHSFPLHLTKQYSLVTIKLPCVGWHFDSFDRCCVHICIPSRLQVHVMHHTETSPQIRLFPCYWITFNFVRLGWMLNGWWEAQINKVKWAEYSHLIVICMEPHIVVCMSSILQLVHKFAFYQSSRHVKRWYLAFHN